MIDPRLQRDIATAEGCKLVAYRDSRGLWTIGYGHLLDQSHDWTGVTITQAAADAQLVLDLQAAQKQAAETPEYAELNICRQNAVTELVFNMGITHWMGFVKCRAALAQGCVQIAARELLNSAWASQVGTRANRLAGYLAMGLYGPGGATPSQSAPA